MSDNICVRFCKTVERRGSEQAVVQPLNKYWKSISWPQFDEHVRKTHALLIGMGVRKGMRVALWAPTSYEWSVFDLAILSTGAITVPIYTNISQSDLVFQLNHSESQVLICQDEHSCKQILALKDKLSFLTSVLTIEPSDLKDNLCRGSWLSLVSKVDEDESTPEEFRKACVRLQDSDPATLIYTSGTTGIPKGVLLGHEQIMSEVSEVFPLLGVTSMDRTLTLLPYAHILGRIELWGQALIGYTIGYASSKEALAQDLKMIKPTIIVGVPRIFEKIYTAILEKSEQNMASKVAFSWAMKRGHTQLQAKQQHKPLSLKDAAQVAVANLTLFKKVREGLGGQLRFAVSGGAPLNPEIAEFFGAMNIYLLEGYGLTETTAAICVNTPFHNQIGTVGQPIGDVEIREASDGEILVRSKKVMLGYFLDPDETEAAFTEDGFLKTGDIGHLNEQGFLVITDRKKDLIKTSSGKFIAPQKLATYFNKHPIIDYIHLHGDRRKFMVALVTVNADAAQKIMSSGTSTETILAEAYKHPDVQKEVRKSVTAVNEQLASHERIKYFKILPGTFSVETGELTPSLKVRRQFCDQKYKDTLEELYS